MNPIEPTPPPQILPPAEPPKPLRHWWKIVIIVILTTAAFVIALYYFLVPQVLFEHPNNNPLNSQKAAYKTALKSALSDLPLKPFTKTTIDAKGCVTTWANTESCTFSATTTLEPSQITAAQKQILAKGWVDNRNYDLKQDPTLSDYSKNGEYFKEINGLPVCLYIADDAGVWINAYSCANTAKAKADAYAGWQRFFPEFIPARYIRRTVDIHPYDGQVTILLALTPTIDSKDPYIWFEEYKTPPDYNPPTHCPITLSGGYHESRNFSCTLKQTTPKGHKIYVSDEYSGADFEYSYVTIDNTLFVIREFNSNTALTDAELSQMIDSLVPLDNTELAKRLPKQ